MSDTGTMTVGDTFTDVQNKHGNYYLQGVVSESPTTCTQQDGTSVSGLTAAQGQAQTVADVAGQTGFLFITLQTGEKIDGPQ